MGIPLVALSGIESTPQPPSTLEQFNQAQQGANLQTQNQQGQLQLQQQQQDLKDQKAMTDALKDWDGQSYEQLAKKVVSNGGSGKAALAVEQHGIQVKTAMMGLDTQQLANLQTKHDLALGELSGADKVPDAQLPQYVMQSVQKLASNGTLTPQEAQEFSGLTQLPPDQLRQQLMIHEASLRGEKAQLAAQQSQAEAAQNISKAASERYKEVNGALMDLQAPGGPKPINASAMNASDWAQAIDSTIPPTMDRQANMAAHADVDFYLKQGNVKAAQDVLTKASEHANQIGNEMNPAIQNAKLQLAERTKRAEQIISQGSPAEAGKLLADGSLTLTELKSRGTTPQFIVEATKAAQQIQPGFNPQKADADFRVASSPSNVAFFGSAKSLTDKGGTLDQLEDAAKDIPGGQIPVFNSIADAYKAATGSGPVAKYASILVGVADDYSKVMGGGQGSDSSRSQALKLAPTSASPEARHAAVEGIRGAVGSQIKSRIGKNTVLQNMYGEGTAPANDPFAQFGGKPR